MTDHTAKGAFDVKMTPVSAADASVGRMTIDKTFHGDLEGTSVGEMLSAGSPQTGSAGYVAIETVTGTLVGRQGAFALQHSGTMHAGQSSLDIAVVPGSGAGALAGLRGMMTIDRSDGGHSYVLTYALPEDD